MWWLAIKSDLLDLACDPFMFDKLHRTHQRERRNSSNSGSSSDDNGMPSQQNKRASYIFIIPGVCAFVVIFSLIPKNRLLHHIHSLSHSLSLAQSPRLTQSVYLFWYDCTILIIGGYYSSGSLYEIIYIKHAAWKHHRYTNAHKTWKWHKNKDSFTIFCHDNKVWLRIAYTNTIFSVVLGFMTTFFPDLLLLQHLYDLA